ncbi:hypothetical protein [Cytobacillus oceanisediminis]|uniref:hypothetical protein n=1 Tax=Cytobacillus oceanisediminis TaxID=665099 RepID=UPI002494B1E2|nr:hypothetical protein [Cytobacillus oceanisediminis]
MAVLICLLAIRTREEKRRRTIPNLVLLRTEEEKMGAVVSELGATSDRGRENGSSSV